MTKKTKNEKEQKGKESLAQIEAMLEKLGVGKKVKTPAPEIKWGKQKKVAKAI